MRVRETGNNVTGNRIIKNKSLKRQMVSRVRIGKNASLQGLSASICLDCEIH